MVSARVANLNKGPTSKSKRSANLPISQPQAAKMLNVSPRSLRDAGTVLATGNERLIRAVEDGRISVSIAAKLADQDQATQDKAVANPDRAATIVKQKTREGHEADLATQIKGPPTKKYGLFSPIRNGDSWYGARTGRTAPPPTITRRRPSNRSRRATCHRSGCSASGVGRPPLGRVAAGDGRDAGRQHEGRR